MLLIDESLTVQKVVALTLDKSKFSILYAKTRAEAMRLVIENAPQLILVSDQVSDINVGAFPKEVEVWLNRRAPVPPLILITAQDLKEVRHFAAVLKKPFSPQILQKLVQDKTVGIEVPDAPKAAPTNAPHGEDFEDQRLQKIFHEAFSDESRLVRETLESEATSSYNLGDEEITANDTPAPTPVAKPAPSGNWTPNVRQTSHAEPARAVPVPPSKPVAPEVMSAADSHAYKATLESKVEGKIESADLQAVVEKVLEKMLPPIVEKIVQARLDALMKDQEQFMELKT